MNKISAPYGSWPSEITSEFLTLGNCKAIVELQVSKSGSPFWVEQTFPAGTRVLFERRADKSIVQWSLDDVSVSNSVYEYGGGSFCIIDTGVVISTRSGLFHLTEPKSAKPLATNDSEVELRYADLFPFGKFVFAVQERHNVTKNHSEEPQNLIVKICVETGDVSVVAHGADFYAEPRVSPDGKYLVWMQWNKPNMPWDYTSLWLAELCGTDLSLAGEPRRLVGDDACYFAPQWTVDSRGGLELYANADVTGFWNIFNVNIDQGGLGENVCPLKMDLANALWNLADDRAYAINVDHVIVTLDHTNPVLLHKLRRVAENAKFRPIDTLTEAGFSVFSFLTIAGDNLFCIAGGSKRSLALVHVDLRTHAVEVIRETRSLSDLQKLPLSAPELITFESDDVSVDGYFYPPMSHTHCSDGSPPPVVFFAHPGPTMRTTNALDLKKQYYTSRGFAVFDINYRGSTGYGTAFRNRLRNNWGIVDAADMINGAKHLMEHGLVNRSQMCMIGSSASGYLVFCVLMHAENPFCAAASCYGIMDLLDLVKDTHKFEADYNIQLIGPYPEAIETYKNRSAIYHLDKLRTPVIFFHGTNDAVVDVGQSKKGFEKLREKGVPTALQIFEGEGHGFRSKDAITKSMDMTYVFFSRVLGIRPSVDCEVRYLINL